jgi:hypothetical protein
MLISAYISGSFFLKERSAYPQSPLCVIVIESAGMPNRSSARRRAA